MRNLSKEQKRYITNWFNENWQGQGSIYSIDQMPNQNALNILALNDHETFWQNADRLITDLALAIVYS